MTTSTNTKRTRRGTAKAPDETAPASAPVEPQDTASKDRPAAKPPAGAGQSAAPADATAVRTRRKAPKPPAEAKPSAAPAEAKAARTKAPKPPAEVKPSAASAEAKAARTKAPKPPAEVGPATTAPADSTVGRTRRKPTKSSSGAGPATTTADAAAADAGAAVRSVAWPPSEMRPWGGATGLRLIDRIERGADAEPDDPEPATTVLTDAAPTPMDVAPPPVASAAWAQGQARAGTAAAPDVGSPAIGTEVRLFDCPSCARPLARGTSRCPGCGVRLFMGVALRRVGTMLAAGIVVCVMIGGGFAAVAMAVGGQAPRTAVASEPSIAPPTPTATPTRSVVAAPVGPPAGALGALSSTAVLNGRINADADTLAATLAKKGVTTIEIARAIRSLAADAALGIEQAGRLTPWVDAAPVMTQLDEFYRSIAQTARVALRASLADATGYRRSGAEMLKVLDALDGVDTASRALAMTVGVELPPLAQPAAP